MAVTAEAWKKRVADRSDLTSHLVHLTRGQGEDEKSPDAVNVVLKILRERKIKGSDPRAAFIMGDQPAVCFQDTPLYHLAQNIHADEVYRKTNADAKLRYVAVGLMFPKVYVFRRGGRPVIYEKKVTAKELLDKNEWWRIVNFDLDNDNAFVDWTHEREWRTINDFPFEIEEATVLLSNHRAYELFMSRCEKPENKDILKSIRGLVCLSAVFL